jgi:hypothetical protein
MLPAVFAALPSLVAFAPALILYVRQRTQRGAGKFGIQRLR